MGKIILIIFILVAMLVGLFSIQRAHPDTEVLDVSIFQTASLNFYNALLLGWADDLAAWFDHQKDPRGQIDANLDYKYAILQGDVKFPWTGIIFSLLGTIFSIPGDVALFIAKDEKNFASAFRICFFAEWIEAVVYWIGMYNTLGVSPITEYELLGTLIASLIVGFTAGFLQSKT